LQTLQKTPGPTLKAVAFQTFISNEGRPLIRVEQTAQSNEQLVTIKSLSNQFASPVKLPTDSGLSSQMHRTIGEHDKNGESEFNFKNANNNAKNVNYSY